MLYVCIMLGMVEKNKNKVSEGDWSLTKETKEIFNKETGNGLGFRIEMKLNLKERLAL